MSTYFLIDTHCHPQMDDYKDDRDAMIGRALDAGIAMIAVGIDFESSKQGIDIANKYSGVWASVGLHPNDNINEPYNQDAYEELLKDSKVVAIGEIGLDFYRTKKQEDQDFQRARFLKQLDLVQQSGKPVIIHCRDAHEQMRVILSQKNIHGVIHSFTGTVEDVVAYTQMGLHIGINGIATFSDQLISAIGAIPKDKILLETDAPFLAPAKYRGKRNEPLYIESIAHRVGEIMNVSYTDICKISKVNASSLFGIDL